MEKPEFNLEMQNSQEEFDSEEKLKAEEEVMREFAYGVKEAESVADLAEIVREHGDADMISAFEKERFQQLTEINPARMAEYTMKEGYLVSIENPDNAPVSVENFDELAADADEGYLEKLKSVVLRAESEESEG